jgi:plastocyanin
LFVAVGLAFLALTVVLVGCGGGSEDKPAVAVPTAAKASSLPAGAPLLDQDRLEFIPNELKVQRGTTIYLKNSEAPVHTVTIEGKNVSGTMKKDDLLAWDPPGPGTYRVTCDFHPLMKATITVE